MASKLPDMGKMVGPLPLGAWVVVVGGGLGFMLYSRRNADTEVADNAAQVVEDDTSGVPGVGTGGSGMWTDLTPDTSDDANNNDDDDYSDNDAWGRAAIRKLIAYGYDATISDSAIRKYLAGGSEKLSIQEYMLIQQALILVGPTPVVLPAPTVPAPGIPKPVTPVKPKPPVKHPRPVKKPPVRKPPKKGRGNKPKPANPHIRYYTVKPGDTLSRIANRFYHNPKEYNKIYNANKKGKRRDDGSRGMISNPNVIRVGWKLIIP